MTTLQESISKCRVEGNTVFLPSISEGPLSNYPELKKAFLNAGAKYKKNTFVFQSDAQPYIDRLMGGENVNIKKEFQFFPTPAELADRLVKLSEIEKHHLVLEPSAGQGAIVEAIHRATRIRQVDCCEINELNHAKLETIDGVLLTGNDFMQLVSYEGYYDRVIANPPFSKNQDIDHIRKMYEVTKSGGRIVTLSSRHWAVSNNKKEKMFRAWLKAINADVLPVAEGAFSESGTSIATYIIVINKL